MEREIRNWNRKREKRQLKKEKKREKKEKRGRNKIYFVTY